MIKIKLKTIENKNSKALVLQLRYDLVFKLIIYPSSTLSKNYDFCQKSTG